MSRDTRNSRPLQISGPAGFAAAFTDSRETLARLETYAAELRLWQRSTNLISPSTEDQIWHRHFADSAQLLALAPDARIWLDLGAGAGFPGLVIAILLAGRPGCRVHLVESSAKKVAFLRHVARNTGAPVDIHNLRIEEWAKQSKLPAVNVVTARALASLGKLLGYAAPFFNAGTLGLFLKGRDVQAELDAARATWRFQSELVPSRTDPSGQIAVIRQLEPL